MTWVAFLIGALGAFAQTEPVEIRLWGMALMAAAVVAEALGRRAGE